MIQNACGICGQSLKDEMILLSSPCLLSDGDLFEGSVSKSFCEHCQILLTTPSSWEKLNARYAVEYSLAEKEVAGEVFREIEGASRSRSLLAKDWLSSMLTKSGFNFENIDLLEIGAGTGALASTFLDNNCRIECVEPNFSARSVCQKRGIRCEADISVVKGEFDFILFFTSLEHINHPLETIKLAASKLRKSGVIAIIVPESIDGSYDYFYGDHLYHFSRISLSKLMNRAGFKEIFYEPGKGWARGVFGAIYKYDDATGALIDTKVTERKMVETRLKRWHKVFATLNTKISKELEASEKRLVVFGAGQIFVFLKRYIPCLDKVDVVVDDNTARYPFAVNQPSYEMDKNDIVLLLFTPSQEMSSKLNSDTSEVISFWSFYEQCI